MMKPRAFSPTPIFFFPRPDRLRIPFGSQRQSKMSPERLREILALFNLALIGNSELTASQGRGDSVIVQTDAGKKMVKRYKEMTGPELVLHEHSILNYLAQIGFPAPRLTQATNGKTFFEKDGKYYALFDYLDGYFHFHNYLFTPAQTREFITASAEALGELHIALQDYTPEGYNPNGFISRQGERWRNLAWYESRLETCKQEASQPGGKIAEKYRQMLAGNVDRVERRLHDLDGILKAAEPLRLIVHGDFGPYNVFFKPGAPVIILDFELARIDWRLTDLSHALYFFAFGKAGFNFKKMDWFLSAYQNVFPLEQDELAMLPDVWQFLSYRRAIVCWHSFTSTKSEAWLDEAQRKLRLADWIERNRKRLTLLN